MFYGWGTFVFHLLGKPLNTFVRETFVFSPDLGIWGGGGSVGRGTFVFFSKNLDKIAFWFPVELCLVYLSALVGIGGYRGIGFCVLGFLDIGIGGIGFRCRSGRDPPLPCLLNWRINVSWSFI